VKFIPSVKMSAISIALSVLGTISKSETLPWYLDKPSSLYTAAAINASNLVQSKDGPPIVVAVIDSGVVSDHPSLKGRVLPGRDMVSASLNPRGGRSDDSSPDDPHAVCPANKGARPPQSLFHGTEVASVIAGNGYLGVHGVNPNVRILPVKAVGVCPASRQDFHDAVAWAGGLPVQGSPLNPNPAKLINISMAGQDAVCHPGLQLIIDRLLEKGVLIVSAAGNTFGKRAREPAVCRGVVSVGAVNPDRSLAFYSASDDRIMIVAPGGGKSFDGLPASEKNRIRVATYDVCSQTGKRTAVMKDSGLGTSFATPLVTGVLAGVMQKKTSLTPQQLLTKIETSESLGDRGKYRYLDYEFLIR
jgi:subtilisin family serine protease